MDGSNSPAQGSQVLAYRHEPPHLPLKSRFNFVLVTLLIMVIKILTKSNLREGEKSILLTVQKTTVHHGGESMAVGVANAESGEKPANAHLLSSFPPFYLVYNPISWGGTTHI